MPQTVRSRVGQLLTVSSLMHRHWGKGPCDAKSHNAFPGSGNRNRRPQRNSPSGPG